MRIGIRLLTLATLLCLVACDVDFLGGWPTAPRPRVAPLPRISPDSGQVVLGDTVVMRAYSDTGDVQVTWSAVGGAVRLVGGAAPSASVQVVGIVPGLSRVTATTATGWSTYTRVQVHEKP